MSCTHWHWLWSLLCSPRSHIQLKWRGARRQTERGRQTDRQTDRQTGWQTGCQCVLSRAHIIITHFPRSCSEIDWCLNERAVESPSSGRSWSSLLAKQTQCDHVEPVTVLSLSDFGVPFLLIRGRRDLTMGKLQSKHGKKCRGCAQTMSQFS